MLDGGWLESNVDRIAKEQGQFCAKVIEDYLKIRIDMGDKIEDITQGYDKDGCIIIFVHNQLVATFRFISEVVESENYTFKYVTTVYREDY